MSVLSKPPRWRGAHTAAELPRAILGTPSCFAAPQTLVCAFPAKRKRTRSLNKPPFTKFQSVYLDDQLRPSCQYFTHCLNFILAFCDLKFKVLPGTALENHCRNSNNEDNRVTQATKLTITASCTPQPTASGTLHKPVNQIQCYFLLHIT